MAGADEPARVFIGRVLQLVTGRDFGADHPAWQQWLDEHWPREMARRQARAAGEPPEVFRTAGLAPENLPPGTWADVRDQVERLFSPDDAERAAASERLGELGGQAAPALPFLIAQLRDENASVRRASAQALGRTGGDGALDALLKIHDDPEINVRTAVLHALAGFDDPRVRSLIIAPPAGDRHGEPIAIQTLARLPGEDVTGMLLERLGSERFDSVKAEIIGILAARDAPGLLEALVPHLESGDRELRRKAADTLAALGDPRAVEPLLRELATPERNPADIARALGELGDPRAAAPLEALLHGAGHPADEAVLETALAKIRGVRFPRGPRLPAGEIPPDMSLLLRYQVGRLYSPGTLARYYAAADVGKRVSDGERAIPWLADMLGDNAELSRQEQQRTAMSRAVTPGEQAAERLAEFRSRALEPLVGALADENWHARRNAARALGQARDPGAVEPLVTAALADEIALVRETALAALVNLAGGQSLDRQTAAAVRARLADGRALAAAAGNIGHRSPAVRTQAAYLLGGLRDPAGLDHLLAVAGDRDGRVRAAAARMLGELGDRRAIGVLVEALGDGEADVARAALAALKKVSGRDLGPDQAEWQAWWAENRPSADAPGNRQAAPED
jgi:HEAT repeat protein